MVTGLTAHGSLSYTWKEDDVYSVVDCSRVGVSVSDRSRSAAKWKGRGSGRRIRRDGIADGVRPARVGDPAFESDHDFGDSVYDHVAFVVDHGDAQCRIGNVGSGNAAEEFSPGKADPWSGAPSTRDATEQSAAAVRSGGTGADRAGKEVAAPQIAEVAELADALA